MSKPTKPKSLGQIAFEKSFPKRYKWQKMTDSLRSHWDDIARAVEREVLRREKDFAAIPRLPMGQALDTILANAWRKNERGHYPKRISWDFCKNKRAFRITLMPRPK